MKKLIAFMAIAFVLTAGSVTVINAQQEPVDTIDDCDLDASQRWALQVFMCDGGRLSAGCYYPEYNGPCCFRTTQCPTN